MPSTMTSSRPAAQPAVQLLRADRRHEPAADHNDASSRGWFGDLRPGQRLLRLRDVLAIVGLSRAHVYNLVRQALFPRPIALGSNCARWVHSEVQAWVDDSIAAARRKPSHQGSRSGDWDSAG